MILAGEIGATRTRLAAFDSEGNRLKCVVEKTYKSQEHTGLGEILPQFTRTEGIPVHSACFGVAGPVRATEYVELLPKARVTGDVSYKSIEIHVGAIVMGRLVYESSQKSDKVIELKTATAD